jgi:hypothetical protein
MFNCVEEQYYKAFHCPSNGSAKLNNKRRLYKLLVDFPAVMDPASALPTRDQDCERCPHWNPSGHVLRYTFCAQCRVPRAECREFPKDLGRKDDASSSL